MSGMIWAGIGKGIADAGQSFASAGMKQLEMDRQDEREALREQRLLERQEALERLKESMLEERAQKDATKAVEVESLATKKGEERAAKLVAADAGKLAANAQQIAGSSPAMTADEMKAHLESLNPQERKAIEGTGLIGKSMSRNEMRLQGAEDQVQAARQLGASSALLKSYQETKKSVLEEIKAENAEKKSDQQHQATIAAITERSRQFDEKKPIMQQNADANTTRANKPAGGGSGDGSPKVRSTKVDDQGNVIAIMSDGSTKPLGIKSGEFNKQVSSLITSMGKNDYQFSKLPEEEKRRLATERLTGGASAKPSDNRSTPAVDALPKGAVQIGTSGGKAVYQTPDGKKFIAK